MRIQHYKFIENEIPDGILFGIPENHRLFATAAIRTKVLTAGLRGVEFTEVP